MSRLNLIGAVVLVILMGTIIVVFKVQYDPKAPIVRVKVVDEEAEPRSVTVTVLLAAYEKDGGRADRAFKNRLCEVSGTIVDKDVNWLGEPVLRLRGDRLEAGTVTCIFQKGEARRTEYMESGEPIVVRGVCQGRIPRYGIRLKLCTVVMGPEP